MTDRRNSAQRAETIALATETLRSSASPGEPEQKERGVSAFWKVFGGTLLSIAALAIITLCQHFNGRLNALQTDIEYQTNDIRKELGRLCEAQTDLLKKDEFGTRVKSIWDELKDLRDSAASFAALKERAALTEQQLRTADEERKELVREVRQLREQRAADDERRELVRELQLLRERLAALEGRRQAATQKPTTTEE